MAATSASIKKFEQACATAIAHAFFHGPTRLDVVTHSKAAAKAWAGDHGVEAYEEDPDASVFERIEIRANPQGRVA